MIFTRTRLACSVAVAAALMAGSAFAATTASKSTIGMDADGKLVMPADQTGITSATSAISEADGKKTATVTINASNVIGKNYGVFANMADGDLNLDVYPTDINVIVSGSTFDKTSSTNAGGAVTLWNSTQWNKVLAHQIVGSTFTGNNAAAMGGAVSLMSYGSLDNAGSTTIENSTFTSNKTLTTKEGQGRGGAIYGEGTKLIVKGSTFESNEAYYGGAISLSTGTTLDISGGTFEKNSATFRGGAIYTDGTTSINIDGAQFIGNTSGDTGGAIAISNLSGEVDPVTIKNTVFDGNTANRKGGAIVIFNMEEDYEHDNAVTLDSVTFRNNKVTAGNGGAVLVEEKVTIQGSTLFEGNSASAEGGAVYAENGSTVAINATEATDSVTFRNNTANGKANDMFLAEGSKTEMKGAGAIRLESGLAGAGAVTSNAAYVYVEDVTGFTGSLTISDGVFEVNAGKFLNTGNYVFGKDATVSTSGEGALKLGGVTKAGTINLTTGTVGSDINIAFEDAFLTGTVTNGELTIETDTTFIEGSDLGQEVSDNLAGLFARGATARESDILEQITEQFVTLDEQNNTKTLSAEGAEAFRQATGGSATAGALNVAYDAQTQFTDSIIRHQLGEHNGYGVWADVYYTSNEAKTLYGDSGYETDIYGGVFGFDATFSCGATAGLAVTVGTGDTDTVGALQSSLDSDFYGVSLYASKDFAGFDAKFDLGYMTFDNDFSGLGAAADVDAWTAGIRGDYTAYQGGVMSITPHVGMRYTHLKSDAVAFNDEASLNVLEVPVGVAFNGNFETNGWKIVPALDFSIVPQLGDTDVDTFAGTVDVIDNLYNTTLGVAATYQNLTFGMDYRYGFGNEDRSNNSVNLKVRYRF